MPKAISKTSVMQSAITEIVDDMGRIMASPVLELLPDLPPKIHPAFLLLLGRDGEAIELTMVLAKTSLMENGKSPPGKRVLRMVNEVDLPERLQIAHLAAMRRDPSGKI